MDDWRSHIDTMTKEDLLEIIEQKDAEIQDLKENIRIARTLWCGLKASTNKLGEFLK